MANASIPKEKLLAALRAFEEAGSQAAGARLLRLPRETFRCHLKAAFDQNVQEEVETPVFPDKDLPVDQVLDHMEARFRQESVYAAAANWFAVKVNTNLPIGIMWFGDPHLGSNGCNIPLLRRDVALCAATAGMYGANIGDTVDNWGGRLIKLYAENDVSRQTERQLARWFLEETGIRWIVWLLGNHDVMDQAFEVYLHAVNGKAIPMMNWRARFRLVFANGREVKIDAAHNHKGHSMWNELHGQERASVMNGGAHLYIAGHHHNWAIKKKEVADGSVVTLARARGYKWNDSFATTHGFSESQNGASIVTIIDPEPRSPTEIVRAFADAAEGADYLEWLRSSRSQ